MADLDEALAIYEDALAEAHRRGSTFAFAAAKVFRGADPGRRGDLAEAEADAREALAAGEAWGASARFTGPRRGLSRRFPDGAGQARRGRVGACSR